MSFCLDSELPWKHTSECLYEDISRKVCLRREDYLAGEYSIVWTGISGWIQRRN